MKKESFHKDLENFQKEKLKDSLLRKEAELEDALFEYEKFNNEAWKEKREPAPIRDWAERAKKERATETVAMMHRSKIARLEAEIENMRKRTKSLPSAREHVARIVDQFDTQTRFEQTSNDTGSVPGHQEVTHDPDVRDGHDYRHLANAYRDIGLEYDEPDTRGPKSPKDKLAKTARGRLHQAIAGEYQANQEESESQMNPEEAMIAKENGLMAEKEEEIWGMDEETEARQMNDDVDTAEEMDRWSEIATEMEPSTKEVTPVAIQNETGERDNAESVWASRIKASELRHELKSLENSLPLIKDGIKGCERIGRGLEMEAEYATPDKIEKAKEAVISNQKEMANLRQKKQNLMQRISHIHKGLESLKKMAAIQGPLKFEDMGMSIPEQIPGEGIMEKLEKDAQKEWDREQIEAFNKRTYGKPDQTRSSKDRNLTLRGKLPKIDLGATKEVLAIKESSVAPAIREIAPYIPTLAERETMRELAVLLFNDKATGEQLEEMGFELGKILNRIPKDDLSAKVAAGNLLGTVGESQRKMDGMVNKWTDRPNGESDRLEAYAPQEEENVWNTDLGQEEKLENKRAIHQKASWRHHEKRERRISNLESRLKLSTMELREVEAKIVRENERLRNDKAYWSKDRLRELEKEKELVLRARTGIHTRIQKLKAENAEAEPKFVSEEVETMAKEMAIVAPEEKAQERLEREMLEEKAKVLSRSKKYMTHRIPQDRSRYAKILSKRKKGPKLDLAA